LSPSQPFADPPRSPAGIHHFRDTMAPGSATAHGKGLGQRPRDGSPHCEAGRDAVWCDLIDQRREKDGKDIHGFHVA
jgi:hypothetical protein